MNDLIDEKAAKKCLADRGYSLGKFFGGGGGGSVYAFCEQKDGKADCSKKVVKILWNVDKYYREVSLIALANTSPEGEITPKQYDAFVCSDLGFMVQEAYEGDMFDLGNRQALPLLRDVGLHEKPGFDEYRIYLYTEEQFLGMFQLILKLRENEIVYGDMKSDQIVQRKQGKEMAVIDFGYAASGLSSTYKQATLGWLPDNAQKGVEDRSIPADFWEYFNLYQLLLWFLERDDKNAVVVLIMTADGRLHYLEDSLVFPVGPFAIPVEHLIRYNRFLFGTDDLPAPSSMQVYSAHLEMLQEAFPSLDQYVSPFSDNGRRKSVEKLVDALTAPTRTIPPFQRVSLEPIKTILPILPPAKRTTLEATIPAKRSTLEAIPPAKRTTLEATGPSKRTTLEAILPVSNEAGKAAVDNAKMPCELQGYEADGPFVKSGRYVYGVFRQVSSGKRFLFRRDANNDRKKWKQYPRSKISSRKLREALSIR